VLDSSGNTQIKMVFDKIDLKTNFNDTYFDLNSILNTEELDDNKEETKNDGLTQEPNSDSKVSETATLDDIIYPMYLPEGTYLENEKTIDLDGGSRIILTFAGDKSFMLVEETALRNDEMVVIPTSGDLELFMDTILIVDDSSLSWISGDVEYYLVSSELNTNELVNIAKSISVLPVGK
jgi:hypothetical protein